MKAGPGPLRRAGLYLGVLSDDPAPGTVYVRGELTRFQLGMTMFYAVTAVALWLTWWASGRRTELELAGFWSVLVLWMCWVGVRRARTPRPDQEV